MKKLLFIAYISLLLPLKTFANSKEIEFAIVNSHSQKLEQLLSNATLTEQKQETYLTLAKEISKYRQENLDKETLQLRDQFVTLGLLSISCSFPLKIYLYSYYIQHPLSYKEALSTFLKMGLISTSLIFYYLAGREYNRTGRRTRKEEYLDSIKVMEILTPDKDNL